jgi:2-keto-4-pentenoate hydratase/2-oxohepta-3-ene-1,7-dioic acid hydratase in catechol pathway
MKLVSFSVNGVASFGVVKDDGVIDLRRRFKNQGINTLRQFLEADALPKAAQLAKSEQPDLKLAEIEFAPVISDPDKIICIGLNYQDHVSEVGRAVTEKPMIFGRWPSSQVGHLQPIIKPTISDHFDYEGELAVVIGKTGRHIKPENALSHIAGYSCYNEGSIRDWQRHTSQFVAGKTFANTGSFGPWLVTADEIKDPTKLKLETRLNGNTVQSSTTDKLIFDIPTLISYCSTILPLIPGDVIVTGTPSGVGLKRNPPLWMKQGDIVEVEISGIGTLKNSVQNELAA